MNVKRLKIKKACTENWENMSLANQGKFCKVCSKTVTDFSKSSQQEILDTLKSSKGEICGRMTSSQLNKPIIEFKEYKEYKLPYSRKIAASLFLVASLTSVRANESINTKILHSNPIVFDINSKSSLKLDTATTSRKDESKIKKILFKGRVICNSKSLYFITGIDEGNKERPIENALIEVFTLEKIYSTYSDKNGDFSIDIPEDLIDNDNVVLYSFSETETIKTKENYNWNRSYENAELILSKEQMTNLYIYEAEPEMLILGGIGSYFSTVDPIVIVNGVELKFKEYSNALKGKKDIYSLKDRKSYHFYSTKAIAIAGQRAKNGLIIFYDE